MSVCVGNGPISAASAIVVGANCPSTPLASAPPRPRLSFTAHSLLLYLLPHTTRAPSSSSSSSPPPPPHMGTQRAIPSSASARGRTSERLSLPFSLPGGCGDLDGFLLPFLSVGSADDVVWSYATLPDSFCIRGRGFGIQYIFSVLKLVSYR